MLIREKIGNVGSFDIRGRVVDWLEVEWYETGKRVLRRRTRGGRELALKFLRESPSLTQGDVLYADESVVILVELLACPVLVIPMGTLVEVASICYETGNRHLPLYIEDGVLLAPLDEPLFRWLVASGFTVGREERKLLYPLRSTVSPHSHGGSW
jgi:urease accessory protein